MSSEQESNQPPTKLSERRAKITDLLSKYTSSMGLNIRPSNEVEHFLNLSQAELRKMTAEECGEASYIIAKAMTYIQLEINKLQADVNWCENYIQFLISKIIHTMGGQYTPFDYKRTLAIKQDDTAMEAHKVITQAKLRLDSLAFITNQLRAIALSFEGLQQTKRSQK